MSQLEGKGHRCQIDCTNHDQVITGLQLKSKDLYYFWRNYEWLYNKYYSQPQPQESPKPTPAPTPNHQRCEREIESLEEKNEGLLRQNKRLKMELETIRKQQADHESYQKMELSYKQELEKERSNTRDYIQINDKLMAENKKLKKHIADLEEEHETERNRLIKEHKKATQTILELQQALDQLRARPSTISHSHPPPPASPSYAEFDELSRRQVTTINSRIKHVASEAEQMVALEYQSLRNQLQDRLAEMLGELSQRQLQSVIVTVQQ